MMELSSCKNNDSYLEKINWKTTTKLHTNTWADPGFLERGVHIMIKSVGVRFTDFISFFLNIPGK